MQIYLLPALLIFSLPSAQAGGCDENTAFTKAADACIEKLNQLEKTLGAEANALAQTGVTSQNGKVGTSNQEYGFSADAMKYLAKIAKQSVIEMQDYHNYVELPPDFDLENSASESDPFAYANNAACFGGVHQKVRDSEAYMGRKIAMYEARINQATSFQKNLSNKSTNFGSANGAVTAAVPANAPVQVPKLNNPSRDSDVTGLKNQPEKQIK
jgi:hypothetical protein